MSVAVNNVVIAGNLTRDVEMRYSGDGNAVAAFDIAINSKWTGADGEVKERVDYVQCSCFGKQAVSTGEYLKQGSPVLVVGHLVQDKWEDKETGKERSKLKVIADRVQFLSTKNGSESDENTDDSPPPRQSTQKPPPKKSAAPARKQRDTSGDPDWGV